MSSSKSIEEGELLKELSSTSAELSQLKSHCAMLQDEAAAMENTNASLHMALEQAKQQMSVAEALSEQGKLRENDLEKVQHV